MVETLFGINEALVKGEIVSDRGSNIGRYELQYGNYIAVISKQRFGKDEQWMLSGYKIKPDVIRESYNPNNYALHPSDSLDIMGAGFMSDVERESYNPDNYLPYSSVSRSKVVADFNAKIQQKIKDTEIKNRRRRLYSKSSYSNR